MCQKVNKQGSGRTVVQKHPIILEPIECGAVDLVGPLPKWKSGELYLFTYACMASRWPEAVPLKNIASMAIAEGLVKIFSRTGLPHTLL